MARGRKFVPPPDRDGFWFTHLGADNSDAGRERRELTSTGDMLSAPYRDTGRPPPPPPPFDGKAQTVYRTVNPFSDHDNRNIIQSRGEYFGDGRMTRLLGRKLLQPLHSRSHHTEQDFLMHHCRQPTLHQYHSEMSSNYTGRPTTSPPASRRFPRQRKQPQSGPLRPLPTSTTDWFPDSPRSLGSLKASTKVLALSQLPFLKHNSWKYSYHGLPDVYPPYDFPPGKEPAVDVPYSYNILASTQR